ncbi:Cochaperone protein [Kalmusia sp. IMI 367209]|nr:Cochaperone protein [Kalmusia sp. IMI 367209]
MDQAARGAAALSASNYDDAVKHYTSALEANPSAVDYYIKRSTAYQRSSKYPEALADAEKAVVLAHKRARRELIKDSQLRRGISLFFLGQYANAEYVLGIVKKLDDKEKTLAIWNAKNAKKLEELPEGDERRQVTAKEVPDIDIDLKPVSKVKEPAVQTPAPDLKSSSNANDPTSTPLLPTEKPKHDWYQTNENVTFTLLAKNVPKDKATIEIEKDSYRITSTKIEVTLKKATPGVKWSALEGELTKETTSTGEKASSHVVADRPTQPKDAVPSYPTSSKTGAKNWDQLAKDDLGEEDEYDGDETSRFFKQLYKGAGEDAQRAMMKSYQESGGTVLSTDWSSVGSKFVKPEPPEGMEEKKY